MPKTPKMISSISFFQDKRRKLDIIDYDILFLLTSGPQLAQIQGYGTVM